MQGSGGSSASPPRGPIADRYEIEGVVGRGGMATVYAVRDRGNGKRLALKHLDRPLGGHESALFEREFRTLAGLRHPRIVEVYEYGVDDGSAYYTMELLDGRDLGAASPLPWRQVCSCLRDVASILGVLHARRLVHRDLSPHNLLSAPDGRLRLVDLGALTPFGSAPNLVGTPPFVPPEALHHRTLDQRTDLFALGALGYWLLTSVHAFPARALDELVERWKREPRAPSDLVKRLKNQAHDVPPELDRLLLSLLRLDPRERPESTADVIDSLNEIADLAPEATSVVVSGYLHSRIFAGRAEQLQQFQEGLRRAAAGQPQAVLVRGREGMGRTRLLEELATSARIGGALVLHADGTLSNGPYSSATQLCLALSRAAPALAHEAAEPHADVLATVSSKLRSELGVGPDAAMGDAAADVRVRKQHALQRWLLGVSRTLHLTLLVDDMQAMDVESQALLSALAHAPAGHCLTLVATASEEAFRESNDNLQALQTVAAPWQLPPLSKDEALELFRSVFGDVHYLDRVVAKLHQVAEGNPRHCLLLAQHLVDSGAARYADGSWTLPREISDEALPATLQEGLLRSVERLSEEASSLASRLSVLDHAPFDTRLCRAVCDGDQERADGLCRELVRHGVLRELDGGYRFAHASLRKLLLERLSDPERLRARHVFGKVLLQCPEPLARARGALHLLRAGEIEQAEAALVWPSQQLWSGSREDLADMTPLFVEALERLRAAGRHELALLRLLSVIAMAGYYVHRRYCEPYGEQAMTALERALHLKATRFLGRLLTARLALLLALIWSGVRLRFIRHAPSAKEALRLALSVASCQGGAASTCMRPDRAWRFADAVRPLRAFGDDHAASVTSVLVDALAMASQERQAEGHRLARQCIEKLSSPGVFEELPPGRRVNLLAAANMLYGIRGAMRDDASALHTAEILERFGPLYEINANQLRAMYYAFRGDWVRAAECRARVDVLAIQLGTTWRVETWASSVTMPLYLAYNATGLKRSIDQIARVAEEMPSYAYHERSARAAYALIRGRPQDAVALLRDSPSTAPHVFGWARTQGFLAAGYNAMGQHDRARKICEEALSQLAAEDLEFVGANINLQVEKWLAEAGLGQFDTAKAGLGALLESHAEGRSALLLGYLERALAHVALLEGDHDACRDHLDAMERWIAPTRSPDLLALLDALRAELRYAESPGSSEDTSGLRSDDVHLLTRIQLRLRSSTTQSRDPVGAPLRIAMEVSGADRGAVLFSNPGSPCVQGLEPVPDAVLAWAARRSAREATGRTLDPADDRRTGAGESPLELDGRRYTATAVWATSGREAGVPHALLVLGFADATPQLPPLDAMRLLAEHLTMLGTDGTDSGSAAPEDHSEGVGR